MQRLVTSESDYWERFRFGVCFFEVIRAWSHPSGKWRNTYRNMRFNKVFAQYLVFSPTYARKHSFAQTVQKELLNPLIERARFSFMPIVRASKRFLPFCISAGKVWGELGFREFSTIFVPAVRESADTVTLVSKSNFARDLRKNSLLFHETVFARESFRKSWFDKEIYYFVSIFKIHTGKNRLFDKNLYQTSGFTSSGIIINLI